MPEKLTVLSIAYPFAPVGDGSAGGAEQILGYIDRALTESGCRSLVIACRGSKVRGHLIEISRTGIIDDEARARVYGELKSCVELSLQRWPVDIVHMHGVDFENYLPCRDVPVLATLHLPADFYSPSIFELGRPCTYLQCVSFSQRSLCPPEFSEIPVIENGVSAELFGLKISRRNFALALGRVCPEKGFHFALAASRKAGVPLLIGGEVYGYEDHINYFRNEIEPRLDNRNFRFLGPLGFIRKRRLLSAARCLLVPSLVPETSSLVAMEAFACGTPVIAFPSGALPDIVEHGKTGFIVGNETEMAEAIARSGSIDPEQCRRSATERFSAARMVREYFQLYRKIINFSTEQGYGAANTYEIP